MVKWTNAAMHEPYEELISDVKQLSLAIRLPVCLYADGEFMYTTTETVIDRVFLASLPIVSGHAHTPQHVKSPCAERCIYMDLAQGWSILIGPYLFRDDEVGLELMVRRGLYDIEQMAEASSYFNSLPRIDYGSAIAIGRLASERYAYKKVRKEFPYADIIIDPVPKHKSTLTGLSTRLPERYYKVRMEDRSDHFFHPSIRLEAELVTKIEAGDSGAALDILRRINRLERATLSVHPLRSLKNSLIGSMTVFTRAAIRGGVPDRTSFTLSDAYIRQIESAIFREELEGLEERAIRAFINLVKEEKQQRYSQPVHHIIRYIDLHLTDDLSIKGLGREVHLHPNYLSTLFRRETGRRISEYIRCKRLEEASYMLRHTNNKMKQIAAFFRFSSQSHFSRAFKEHYGVTPSAAAKGKG